MHADPFRLRGVVIDGRYRADEVVGEGGFGVVYRGFHLGFHHPIAIKCLKVPAHFTGDAQRLVIHRFREEGAMLSHLAGHPAIVRVFDFGVTAAAQSVAVPYLVLEWLDGKPLDAWLADHLRQAGRPLDAYEAATLLRPAIDALALTHGEGIAHRDIKPANLFIVETRRGRQPKILDFGIAKAMQEGETATHAATRTASGFSAFSPEHGAPEQFWSKSFGPTGPWTDVHALGLLLVEMVTGRPAYDGSEPGDFFMAATAERRPTPRARGATVPDAFEALCARALARMPTDRFNNARAMLEAIDHFLAGGHVIAAPVSGEAMEPPPATLADPPIPAVTGEMSSAPAAGARTVPPTIAPFESPIAATATPIPSATSLPIATTTPPISSSPTVPFQPTVTPYPAPSTTGPHRQFTPPPIVPPPPAARRREPPWGLVAGAAFAALALIGGIAAVAASRGHGDDDDPTPIDFNARPRGEAPALVDDDERRKAAGANANANEMVTIPGGSFTMGASDGTEMEKPPHVVSIATFDLDAAEVTVAAYRACVDAGNCTPALAPAGWGRNAYDRDRWSKLCNFTRDDRLDHPINCVDAAQAEAFCRAAGKRLPTEEEWEFAARAGAEQLRYPWGNTPPTPQHANICGPECVKLLARFLDPRTIVQGYTESDGWETTAPVKSFAAGLSRHGVWDLGGNVAEWTSSAFCAYSQPNCREETKVIRGSSWAEGRLQPLRTSYRAALGSQWIDSADIGFRCAR